MDIRFDGKRALVTGAGKGKVIDVFKQIVCFLESFASVDFFSK